MYILTDWILLFSFCSVRFSLQFTRAIIFRMLYIVTNNSLITFFSFLLLASFCKTFDSSSFTIRQSEQTTKVLYTVSIIGCCPFLYLWFFRFFCSYFLFIYVCLNNKRSNSCQTSLFNKRTSSHYHHFVVIQFSCKTCKARLSFLTECNNIVTLCMMMTVWG